MDERRQALIITVALVFLSSALSYYAGAANLLPRLSQRLSISGAASAPKASDSGSTASGKLDYNKLDQLQQYIQSQYVDPISTDKLLEGALKGMVEATGDKYSAYMSPTEYKNFRQHLDSTFTGIGVTVETSPKTGYVTVVAPIKNSPGEKAGLKTGDAIIQVDGKDITKLTLDEAVNLIKGPSGTKVKLTVLREGVQEPLTFTITRAKIDMPTIEWSMKEDGIGYVKLYEFNDQLGDRLSKAIADLKSKGMTRLILDLRGNPGGLLTEAVNVASQFLPPGAPVVHIVDRKGEKETFTSKAKSPFNMPLVVLVDGGSASASEIVSGAIKDLKAGVLMGTKTFGKGTVQTFFDMTTASGEKAGLKLTTARYLTAGGNSIHEKGIMPDVVVEQPKDAPAGSDLQLDKAIAYIKTMK